jgi:tyrosyl-tRNA synthetase
VGTDGSAKMSKSLGNAIGIADPAPEMFGKIMSLPDELMATYFDLVTDLGAEEIAAVQKGMADGSLHPMDLKKRLAREVVSRFHGPDAASAAEGDFKKHVQEKKIPDDVPEFGVPSGESSCISIVELAMMAGLGGSKSQVRRLIDQGGVELEGVRVADRDAKIEVTDGMLLRVGKRKYARFRIEG